MIKWSRYWLIFWLLFHHGVTVYIQFGRSHIKLHKISIKYCVFSSITHCWLLSDQPFVKKVRSTGVFPEPDIRDGQSFSLDAQNVNWLTRKITWQTQTMKIQRVFFDKQQTPQEQNRNRQYAKAVTLFYISCQKQYNIYLDFFALCICQNAIYSAAT